MNLSIIVLAAGKGTRMYSDKPKVIHSIAGRPMLQHVLDSSAELKPNDTFVITGYKSDLVQAAVTETTVHWIKQKEQLGTGHAVQQVLPVLSQEGFSLILYGDVPLISAQTLALLTKQVEHNTLALLTQHVDKPTGYGRIVRDQDDSVTSIVEQKDASVQQLLIKEINTGIMAVNNKHLHQWLPALTNDNAQGEFYLTDLIALAVNNNVKVNTVQAQYDYEIQGVNNKKQLSLLEKEYQQAQAEKFLEQGVHIVDSARFDVRGSLITGKDCYIDINCIFEGHVRLGNNVHIEANCIVKNSTIADNVHIKANTLIDESSIGNHCELGPFARIRPQTELAAGVKIGNFVETKKSMIGPGSKVNHLSYIGDADIGSESNIGAGTITCNYDGVNKHKTVIGDNVRIGSNSSLVAPVTISNKSTTGAGAIIRKHVEEDTLAISIAKQKNISGWQRPEKKDKT